MPQTFPFRRQARLALVALLALLSFGASAKEEEEQSFELPVGTVHVANDKVYVGNQKIFGGLHRVQLHDFGTAGILIEAHSGGAWCPSSFHLIHPETGALRIVNPGHDRDTVFGECQRLEAVVPALRLVVMAPNNSNEQAQVYSWNGFRMTHTVLPPSLEDVPMPPTGPGVERWIGRYLFEWARDPQEQRRLLTVLDNAQLAEFNRVVGKGSPIERRGEFIVGSGCWPGLCEGRWAVLALRISDGATFVLMSDGTIAVPKGETLPDLLKRVNSIGQLQ